MKNPVNLLATTTVAGIFAVLISLFIIRLYTFNFILPAARQTAFRDRVNSEKELVEYLKTKYVLVERSTNTVATAGNLAASSDAD